MCRFWMKNIFLHQFVESEAHFCMPVGCCPPFRCKQKLWAGTTSGQKWLIFACKTPGEEMIIGEHRFFIVLWNTLESSSTWEIGGRQMKGTNQLLGMEQKVDHCRCSLKGAPFLLLLLHPRLGGNPPRSFRRNNKTQGNDEREQSDAHRLRLWTSISASQISDLRRPKLSNNKSVRDYKTTRTSKDALSGQDFEECDWAKVLSRGILLMVTLHLGLVWSWAHLDLKWALTLALLYKVARRAGLAIYSPLAHL